MSSKKTKAKAKVKAKAKSTPPAPAKSAQKPQLPSINEFGFLIMGTHLIEDNRELFKEDPHEYLFSLYNMEMPPETDITVVENDLKTMHLVLPYYKPQFAPK